MSDPARVNQKCHNAVVKSVKIRADGSAECEVDSLSLTAGRDSRSDMRQKRVCPDLRERDTSARSEGRESFHLPLVAATAVVSHDKPLNGIPLRSECARE